MAVYKRGAIWWYKFQFEGQLIRDSAKTKSKTVARDAERERRRELERSFNRIPKRGRMPLFAAAAEQWLATKRPRSEHRVFHYRQYVDSLSVSKRMLERYSHIRAQAKRDAI